MLKNIIKNIKLLILVSFATSLQDCSINSMEKDFSYESLSNLTEAIFRNRKFDYARVAVVKQLPLKLPAGLNEEQINPKFIFPDGDNNFAKFQIAEAKKGMLPPGYNNKFDIDKIIKDQLSEIAVTMVYDDKGNLKLVFREPLQVTINLLNSYFKKHSEHYLISSSENKFLAGHQITIEDLAKNLIFVIKIRKIDELSSLVTMSSMCHSNEKVVADNHINQKNKLLRQVHNNLNGKILKIQDDFELAQAAKINPTKNLPKTKSALAEMASGFYNFFSFGSYNKKVQQDQKQDQS